MKVRLYIDNSANMDSIKSETVDTEDLFGINDEEWGDMSTQEKETMCKDWVNDQISWGWEEL